MEHKKSRFRWPTIGAVAVLLVAMLIGSAIGKYVTTVTVSGKVTFTAELAKSITLQEHKAERNADGSYTLNASETVTENTYTLLPGLDIPKDPYITITGKTPIAAYLFLIVNDQLKTDSGISYTLADCWRQLGNDYPGVYVYSDENGAISITDKTEGLSEINILEDNIVYVSQDLADTLTDVKLSFSAVLKEIGKNGERARTAAEVYGASTTQP